MKRNIWIQSNLLFYQLAPRLHFTSNALPTGHDSLSIFRTHIVQSRHAPIHSRPKTLRTFWELIQSARTGISLSLYLFLFKCSIHVPIVHAFILYNGVKKKDYELNYILDKPLLAYFS